MAGRIELGVNVDDQALAELTQAAQQAGAGFEDLARQFASAQDVFRALDPEINRFIDQLRQVGQATTIPPQVRRQLEQQEREIAGAIRRQVEAHRLGVDHWISQERRRIDELRRAINEQRRLMDDGTSDEQEQARERIRILKRELEDRLAVIREHQRTAAEVELGARTRLLRLEQAMAGLSPAQAGGAEAGLLGALTGLLRTSPIRFGLSILGGLGLFRIGQELIQGVQQAMEHQVALGELSRRVRTAQTDFQAFRDELFRTAEGLGYVYDEVLRVADAYSSLVGRLQDAHVLTSEVRSILEFSRGFGIEPQLVAAAFGEARRLGITRAYSPIVGMDFFPEIPNLEHLGAGMFSLDELALAMAAAMERAGMRGREAEFMQAVNRLVQAVEQTSGFAPSLVDVLSTIVAMARPTPAGAPIEALRGQRGVSILQQLNQALVAPGGGEAGEFFIFSALGQGRLDYFQVQLLRRLGLFARPQDLEAIVPGLKLPPGLIPRTNLEAILQELRAFEPNDTMARWFAAERLTGIPMPVWALFERQLERQGTEGFRQDIARLQQHLEAAAVGLNELPGQVMAEIVRIGMAQTVEEARRIAEEAARGFGIQGAPEGQTVAQVLRWFVEQAKGLSAEGKLATEAERTAEAMAGIVREFEKFGQTLVPTVEALKRFEAALVGAANALLRGETGPPQSGSIRGFTGESEQPTLAGGLLRSGMEAGGVAGAGAGALGSAFGAWAFGTDLADRPSRARSFPELFRQELPGRTELARLLRSGELDPKLLAKALSDELGATEFRKLVGQLYGPLSVDQLAALSEASQEDVRAFQEALKQAVSPLRKTDTDQAREAFLKNLVEQLRRDPGRAAELLEQKAISRATPTVPEQDLATAARSDPTRSYDQRTPAEPYGVALAMAQRQPRQAEVNLRVQFDSVRVELPDGRVVQARARVTAEQTDPFVNLVGVA